MEEPHIKCESEWLVGAGETSDCVQNLPTPPADERLPAVKVEPLAVIAEDDDDVHGAATSIVKEEYEIKENFEFVSEVTHLKEETESELTESGQTQEKSFEPFPEVKVEILVEEHTVGQLGPCSKEENSVVKVAVLRRGPAHSCDACCKTFETGRKLKYHLLTHEGERPHSCTVCNRTFATKGHLNSHLLSHSGERPHRCNQCDSAFIRKAHLRAHQLSHSGERPFCCNECGSTFSRKSYLKTHLVAHSGLRPFHCSICNCTFSRKFNLKQHQLSGIHKN